MPIVQGGVNKSAATNIFGSLTTWGFITGTLSSQTDLQAALNGKQPTGSYLTSVTGTAPIASSGGSTPAISIPQANATTDGYLSHNDWLKDNLIHTQLALMGI